MSKTMKSNDTLQYQKLLFLLLDPVIQQLLNCQEELNSIVSKTVVKGALYKSSDSSKHVIDEMKSKIICLHKEQVELFSSLKNTLGNIGRVNSDGNHVKDSIVNGVELNQVRNALFEMEKYITLPIILCFQYMNKLQQGQRENDRILDTQEKDVMDNFEIIESSALRNAIESAASCLTLFTRIMSIGWLADDTTSSNDSVSCLLSVDIRMKCVISVSTALTLVLESLNGTTKHKTNNFEDTTFDVSSRSKIHKQLDKGGICLCALLGSLYTLLSVASNEISFLDELFSYIPNSGLIFGIIQNCIHCLNHDALGAEENSHRGNSFANQVHLDKTVRGNVQLQLDSLNVIEALLSMSWKANETRVDERDRIKDCFQHAFPSCFGVLFRHTHLHLRFSTSLSSCRLSVRLITTLSELIKRTLENYSIQQNRDEAKAFVNFNIEKKLQATKESAMKLMNTAQTMGTKRASADTRYEIVEKFASIDLSEDENVFIDNVRGRIPIPLSIVLKLIPSQKSVHVRKAGILCLCKTVLVDTYLTWILIADNNDEALEEKLKTLRESAFECLVILLDDSHVEVSEAAKKVLELHQMTLRRSDDINDRDHHQTLIENIMENIQSLPSIARSRKEFELRLKMKLICGYISMVGSRENRAKGYNYQLKRLIKDHYKKCLVDIFILDDSVAKNLIVSEVSNTPQFIYMLDENTVEMAKRMIREIAQLLGTKLALVFADECIADVYESICVRQQNDDGIPTYDLNHFKWIQENFGLLTLGVELIHGIHELDDFEIHHIKKLNSFTLSTLPILFSDHFWQLPTASKLVSSKNVDPKLANERKAFTDSAYDLLPSLNVIDNAKSGEHQNILFSTVSFAALYGNSLIQCALMDIIEGLSALLRSHFQQYITTSLYPLLQKTSDINCISVQQHAFRTLNSIALNCGFSSFQNLLSNNFRFIIEEFNAQLQGSFLIQTTKHIHQQCYCFYTLQSVMRFLKQSIDEEASLPNNANHCTRDKSDCKPMLVIDLMKTLNNWFINNFKKGIENLIAFIVIPIGIVEVFTACIEYVEPIFHHTTVSSNTAEADFQWMNLLIQFELEDNPSFYKSSGKINHDRVTPVPTDVFSICSLQEMIKVMQEILLTNSMFLSIPNIQLQRISCKLFNRAFHLLHMIQLHCKLVGNEHFDIGNPLLQTVNKYWHPLQKRYQTTSDSLCERSRNAPARMHLILLHNSLLETISILSQICDGFMCQRFQHMIFPSMSNIFHLYTSQIKDGEAMLSFSLKEDKELLSPLLDCIKTVFSAEGLNLQAMVGLVGSIILPFVGVEGRIGISAMNAMKTLLSIDSDCMWRALIKGSNSDIPQRPLLPFTLTKQESTVANIDNGSTFCKCCYQLMEFTDSLPEQSIIIT